MKVSLKIINWSFRPILVLNLPKFLLQPADARARALCLLRCSQYLNSRSVFPRFLGRKLIILGSNTATFPDATPPRKLAPEGTIMPRDNVFSRGLVPTIRHPLEPYRLSFALKISIHQGSEGTLRQNAKKHGGADGEEFVRRMWLPVRQHRQPYRSPCSFAVEATSLENNPICVLAWRGEQMRNHARRYRSTCHDSTINRPTPLSFPLDGCESVVVASRNKFREGEFYFVIFGRSRDFGKSDRFCSIVLRSSWKV